MRGVQETQTKVSTMRFSAWRNTLKKQSIEMNLWAVFCAYFLPLKIGFSVTK